jgi:excisionase family DNA binding protein
LTVTELAERLGVSRAHAYRLIAQGTIPVVTLGRTIRIPVRAYERWLAEQAATAAKAALR